MKEIKTLIKADTISAYKKEISFVKNRFLLEIQQTIKEAEFNNGALIEEFSEKFYKTIIDSVMVLHKKMDQYKVDIESNISIFEDALEMVESIDSDTDELSVLLQSTYDDVKDLLHDIDTEIEYLRSKIKRENDEKSNIESYSY